MVDDAGKQKQELALENLYSLAVKKLAAKKIRSAMKARHTVGSLCEQKRIILKMEIKNQQEKRNIQMHTSV